MRKKKKEKRKEKRQEEKNSERNGTQEQGSLWNTPGNTHLQNRIFEEQKKSRGKG